MECSVDHKREKRNLLPEITNVSRLQRYVVFLQITEPIKFQIFINVTVCNTHIVTLPFTHESHELRAPTESAFEYKTNYCA